MGGKTSQADFNVRESSKLADHIAAVQDCTIIKSGVTLVAWFLLLPHIKQGMQNPQLN